MLLGCEAVNAVLGAHNLFTKKKREGSNLRAVVSLKEDAVTSFGMF
jgi:hypothetical protein